MIRLEPRFAEYWKDGVTSGVGSVLEAAKALLGATDPSGAADHAKLRW